MHAAADAAVPAGLWQVMPVEQLSPGTRLWSTAALNEEGLKRSKWQLKNAARRARIKKLE
jgi:hypothetical protein